MAWEGICIFYDWPSDDAGKNHKEVGTVSCLDLTEGSFYHSRLLAGTRAPSALPYDKNRFNFSSSDHMLTDKTF